jgi:hypothetical protein
MVFSMILIRYPPVNTAGKIKNMLEQNKSPNPSILLELEKGYEIYESENISVIFMKILLSIKA